MAGGNDSFTKILLHMDGVNGGTTFTDDNFGGSAHTWTATTDTTSTTQAKFGTASLTTAGSGGVQTPDSTDFTLGTSDFTADCWFWVAGGAGAAREMFGQCDTTGADPTKISIIVRLSAANVVEFYCTVGGTFTIVTGTTAFTTTGWHHVAATRNGTTLRLFVDGVQEGGNIALAGSINDSAFKFGVGCLGEFTTLQWNGFIDEFRLSVGIARWTSNFTPPTVPYDGNANANIAQAAGIGVAGSLTASPAALIIGVSGIGVARGITPTVGSLNGVTGTGVAGSLTTSLSTFPGAAAGVGVAGFGIAGQIGITPPGVQGTGVAGTFGANSIFITIGIPAVVGIGAVGQLNPTTSPATTKGVSCVGIAGKIGVILSGGSGGAAAAGNDDRRRKKLKTGFEPVIKRPQQPETVARKPLPLPPFKYAPPLAPPERSPLDLVDRDLIPQDLLGLQDQIFTAQDVSDIERLMRGIDQDEQDAADIADVLALLD